MAEISDSTRQKYPESAKLAEASESRNAIQEFLEFLGDKGISLGHEDEFGRYVPNSIAGAQLLDEFFGLDWKKLEAERRQMLAELAASDRKDEK